MDLNFEILEELGCVEESLKSDWGIFVNRVSWNGKEPKIDIRKINPVNNRISKGISLKDSAVENLTNILIKHGFGDVNIIKDELNKRDSIFQYNDGNEEFNIKI